MDIVGRDQFRQLLRRPEQADRIILISTHQAHDLEQVISRILFIDSGKLALSSSMEELARRLRMGTTTGEQSPVLADTLYSEAIGNSTVYIAARAESDPVEPVQLELLYRALCRAPQQVLRAMANGAHPHV
jgi:ABC-2 type transport system ATP-binding protein